jgi:hypothetical protein
LAAGECSDDLEIMTGAQSRAKVALPPLRPS